MSKIMIAASCMLLTLSAGIASARIPDDAANQAGKPKVAVDRTIGNAPVIEVANKQTEGKQTTY